MFLKKALLIFNKNNFLFKNKHKKVNKKIRKRKNPQKKIQTQSAKRRK